MLERATAFLIRFGCDCSFPILPVKTLGGLILGEAKNGKAYISLTAFERGTRTLTSTIYEEMLHLKTGFRDCSRELQDSLLEKVISLMEELTGEPL
jgi:hypothetical protein